MSAQKVRARFAPSPTGYLHLGGARTALFAWAWARGRGGEFLLRVEDTDSARNSDSHTRAIIDAMQWLGLHFDGAAQFQSQNRERHLQLAARLEKSGATYRDEGALRLKTPPDGEISFDDRVCGILSVDNKELEDPVLLRGDGSPTYIFASAADDIADAITDVIRGDDHIRNTHKQLHIYAALGETPPRFAHLPMILSADGERLSKRHAAVDVMQYRQDGFLSAALVNYLARLSWSRGDAEFFDSDFLLQHFNFDSVQRAPARFDIAKLRWLNGEHLRALSPAKARELIGIPELSDAAIALVLPRGETLEDARAIAEYLVRRPPPNSELLQKHCSEENRAALRDLREKLSALSDSEWNAAAIKGAIKETAREHKLKFPQIGMPLRALLTAREQSPDIAEVAATLGKVETLGRMESLG